MGKQKVGVIVLVTWYKFTFAGCRKRDAQSRPLAFGFSWETANCSLQLCVYSITLLGFHNFFQGVHCLVPPCCFSSSQTASLLWPKN